jgi:capsule polysaccharide export protein KpsE/RkpR
MQLRDVERELPLEDVNMSPDHNRFAWVDNVNRLWSQRRRIALWALAGLVAGSLCIMKYCKYEASVALMPPDSAQSGLSGLLPALSKVPGLSGAGSGLAGLAGDMLGMKSSGALFTKVLESRTVEDAMVDRFDLQKRFPWSETLWRKRKVDARDELHRATKIEDDKKSGVVSITVRNSDPARARDMANEYVTQLNKVLTSVMNTSAGREKEFIKKRLNEEEALLHKAEKDLSEFSSGSMAFDPSQQIRVTVESAARLQGELIAARAELQGLQQIYTSENVRIKSLRARIGELEQELRKINGGRPLRDGGAQDAFPYPSAKALPALGVQWADLYRESKIHETVFEMLTQQYEVARIQEAKETPTAKILDDAVLPEKTFPRPWVVMLIGTITGVILGCSGVLLQDKLQALDVADPRRVLLSNMYYGTRGRANSIWNAVRFKRVIGHDQNDRKF